MTVVTLRKAALPKTGCNSGSFATGGIRVSPLVPRVRDIGIQKIFFFLFVLPFLNISRARGTSGDTAELWGPRAKQELKTMDLPLE